MYKRIVLPRFDKGLISDRNDIKGGLEYCNNVIPINGGSEWRTRSGKVLNLAHNSLSYTNGFNQIHSLLGTVVIPSAVYGIGSVSSQVQYITNNASGNSTVFSTQALDNTGSARSITGFTNRFSLPAYASSTVFDGQLLLTSDMAGKLPAKTTGTYASSSEYSTGTVAGTSGQKLVTGSSTVWTSNHVGMYLWVNDTTISEKYYRIVKVISGTSIQIDHPLATTFTGKNYRIVHTAPWSCKPGTFGAYNHTSTITANSMVMCAAITGHVGRVFGANTIEADNNTQEYNRVRWSATQAETATGATQWQGADYWHPNAYLDVFPGIGGDAIYGLASHDGDLYIFKKQGVFRLKGFVATDGTDIGASVEVVSLDHGQYQSTSQPIVSSDGVWFVSRKGLCVVNRNGVTDFTDRTGVRNAFDKYIRGGDTDQESHFSITEDYIIIQTKHARADCMPDYDTQIETPNTMVYFRKDKVWATQSTIQTTRIIQSADEHLLSFAGTLENTTNKPNVVDWYNDLKGLGMSEEDGQDPLMDIITLPINVTSITNNARIKSIHTRYYLNDINLNNPTISVAAIPGEREVDSTSFVGTLGAPLPELSDANTGDLFVDSWGISRFSGGANQYDSYRFRWKQTAGSSKCYLYEAGVDYYEVRRVR